LGDGAEYRVAVTGLQGSRQRLAGAGLVAVGEVAEHAKQGLADDQRRLFHQPPAWRAPVRNQRRQHRDIGPQRVRFRHRPTPRGHQQRLTQRPERAGGERGIRPAHRDPHARLPGEFRSALS
jgi:hypothetical protein